MLDSARSTPTLVAAGSREGPAIARHRLGARLRRLREERSLRLEDVAAHVGVRPSSMSRIETGEAPARAAYLSIMLDLYQVTDPAERAELTNLAWESSRKDWLARCHDILPPGAEMIHGVPGIKSFWLQAITSLDVKDASLTTVSAMRSAVGSIMSRVTVSITPPQPSTRLNGGGCMHRQSNISTVRATSPAFIARNASLMSPRRPRRLTISSSFSRTWR